MSSDQTLEFMPEPQLVPIADIRKCSKIPEGYNLLIYNKQLGPERGFLLYDLSEVDADFGIQNPSFAFYKS
jgi:hypothetical protein